MPGAGHRHLGAGRCFGGTDLTTLGDKVLTVLRRERIGFVFQSFNLLRPLTAEENIMLPLSIAGRKPDRAWVARSSRGRSVTGSPTGPAGSPVASSRALPPPGRSPPGPEIVFADEPTGELDSVRRRAAHVPRRPSWTSARPS